LHYNYDFIPFIKLTLLMAVQDEQAEMLALLGEWTDAIKEASNQRSLLASSPSSAPPCFLGGESITLADLMVFGVIRGLTGLPVHDLVLNSSVELRRWYRDVEECIEQRQQRTAGAGGAE
jgi:hypothetical protein